MFIKHQNDLFPFLSHFTEDVAEVIGFTAYATKSTNYNNGDVVMFEGVLTNIGQNYQNESGIFTCAQRGVYMFSWTLYTNTENRMGAELYVDNESLYLQTYTSYHTQSMSVVVECDSNKKVWLRCSHDDSFMWVQSPYTRSTFSGYLLYAY